MPGAVPGCWDSATASGPTFVAGVPYSQATTGTFPDGTTCYLGTVGPVPPLQVTPADLHSMWLVGIVAVCVPGLIAYAVGLVVATVRV